MIALLILIMCLAITTNTLSLWNKAAIKFDLAKQRETLYNNFYLTELILNYGITVVKKNYDLFIKQTSIQEALIFDISDLIRIAAKGAFNAKLCISRGQGLMICAKLYDGEHIINQLTCDVVRDKNAKYFIKNFTLSNSI